MTDLPDYVLINREHWDEQAKDYVANAQKNWAPDKEPEWGIWNVPESEVGMLDLDLDGKDVIELGCGTGYVSAWCARRGARVVGIDNSEEQLKTAQRMQQEHALEFELIHGNAETVPKPDASFDFAISEYGACLWADPGKWVPEAARLLRPGGRLHFLTNSWLMMLCASEYDGIASTNELVRPALGMYRVEWPDDPGVEFHLSHADWIALLRTNGFEIEALVDLYPDEDATTRYPFVTLDWARQWPCEEVWKVRKR